MQKALPVLMFVLALGIFVFFVTRPASSTKDYNVIVIAFDGLQAKHLHSYGYPLETTPNLDAFVKDSYLFTNTVSPASWTVPTYMSIFTSMYPSEHKLLNKLTQETTATGTKAVISNIKKLSPDVVTLAEIMKRNGYATGGFTGDAGVGAPFGYGQGFDTYYDKETFGGFDKSIPEAKAWLADHKDEKFFMFVHGYDVHGQHAPAAGFTYKYVEQPYTGAYTGAPKEQGRLREAGLKNELNLSESDIQFWRAIYDEKINDADAQFGDFLAYVDSLGIKDKTIIVVLSDHGTEFYEHGKFDHGQSLYSELVNVLFAIHVPGQEGKKIDSLVSTLDLAPTLLSVLGIRDEASKQMRGTDVRTSFVGRDVSHDVYSETNYRLFTFKRSLTTPEGWKVILTRETDKVELYNLNDDPNELTDLAATEPKRAYELQQKLLTHLEDVGDTGPWTLGCLPVYADQCQ